MGEVREEDPKIARSKDRIKMDWKAKRKIQKEKQKEKKKTNRQLAGEEQCQKEPRLSRKAKAAEFMAKKDSGAGVLLDLEWEHAHTEKALKSLVNQVLYCYGAIRKASKPVRLMISGLHCESEMYRRLHKISGFEKWAIEVSEKPYIDTYSKEQLVYLTPDAEETVEQFEQDKIYIIGGI